MSELEPIPVVISEALIIEDIKKKINIMELNRRIPRPDLEKQIAEFEDHIKLIEGLKDKHKSEKDVLAAEIEILKQEVAEQVSYREYMDKKKKSLIEKLNELEQIRNEKDELLKQKLELTKLSISQQLSQKAQEAEDLVSPEVKNMKPEEVEEELKLQRVNTPIPEDQVFKKTKAKLEKMKKKNGSLTSRLPRVASLTKETA